MHGGQVDNFVHQTQNVPEPALTVDGRAAAKVPFKTAYILDGEQEEELIRHAVKRMKEMESELGRVQTEGITWFQSFVVSAGVTWRTHFGKRFVYDQIYHNEVEWRKWLLGGIFATMNHCVPIVRGVCSQMIARANNYFFATDPWFSSYPMGEAAKVLAEKLDRWTQWKFGLSEIKKTFEKATELAFIRGESVIKTTYETKEQIFKQVSTVLTDPAGKDILDSNGDYINIGDVWIPQLTPAATDPQTGLAVPPTKTGAEVLKRDRVTIKPAPDVIRWVTKTVTRRRTMFKGAKSEVVYYRDFLCPLSAANVQDADCICHLYDMPVMDIIDTYMRKGMIDLSAADEDSAMQRLISQIRDLSTSSGIPKSAANQPRPELNQVELGPVEQSNPIFQIAEFHLRYDADGDGIMENIILVIDRRTETPLFYDFIDNVTPDGERPFDVIRINEVDGRWYGIGAMEMFESSQETIDLLVNRWHLSQSEAGRVTLWRPYLTMEGDSNKNLRLNSKRTYTPKPGVKNEEVLSYITLPDIKHADLKDSFQFYMQLITNESGVATANDARAAGLDTGELATGVRNIEKAGQEKFSLFLSPLERGYTSAARRNMRLELAHIDKDETFVFFEDQVSADTLTQEDAQSVMVDIQMLLTRYRGQQIVQSVTQGLNAIVQFYTYPTTIQPHIVEGYRDLLDALGFLNSKTLIVPSVGQITQGSGGQPGQPGQSGTPAGMPALNPAALTAAVSATPPGESNPNL